MSLREQGAGGTSEGSSDPSPWTMPLEIQCREDQDSAMPYLNPQEGCRLWGFLWLSRLYFPMHQRQSTWYRRSTDLIGTRLIFESLFESKWKCKYLKISTLTVQLVPRLFAQFEKCSCDYIIPLDINEFLFARYMFQLRCKVTHFSRKTCRMYFFFTVHPNE